MSLGPKLPCNGRMCCHMCVLKGGLPDQNPPAPCHHTGSLTTSVIAATASAPNSLKTSDRKVNLITKMSHVVVSVQRRWKEALSGASVQYMIHCFSLGDVAKLDFSPADLQVASRPDVLKSQIHHIPVNKILSLRQCSQS